MVGLDFEGWEEGSEAVFGYGATRVWWCHCEGEVKPRLLHAVKEAMPGFPYGFTIASIRQLAQME